MLDIEQINSYEENGFLIVENLFDKTEVDELKIVLKGFEKHIHQPNVICEDNGGIRSVFAPEKQEPIFGNLVRDERLLSCSEQLLNNKLYLYQYKLNLKEAFVGKFWEWHQDFPYWHHDDGIKIPEMVSVMLILDDVQSCQGPLLMIPKSHKEGIADFNAKEHLLNGKSNLLNSLTSDLKYTVSNDLVKNEAEKNGIESFVGKAGSVLFFHPNVYHASNMNVSPFERSTAIITYNTINNAPEKLSSRPEYICYSDITPLEIL